jgi:hypothetical protein
MIICVYNFSLTTSCVHNFSVTTSYANNLCKIKFVELRKNEKEKMEEKGGNTRIHVHVCGGAREPRIARAERTTPWNWFCGFAPVNDAQVGR